MIKISVIAACVALSACTAASHVPVMDTSRVPDGRSMESDLALCREAVTGDTSDALATNSMVNTVMNAVIHSALMGRISPYTVSSVAQRGTSTVIQKDNRDAREIDACMRRAGWKVY